MTILQRWFGARRSSAPRTAARNLLLFLAAVAPGWIAAQTNYTPYAFTTLAGRASTGSDDGPGATARFSSPGDIAVDRAGNLYVADTGNGTIRKVAPNGTVTTLAGLAGVAGATDGTGSAARFNAPEGIAVDAFGTVYVADTGNFTIRKITPAGAVTTLAGAAGASDSVDGVGTAARFAAPTGVAVDSAGDVFVAEQSSYLLRKVTPAGAVTTFFDLTSAIDGAPIVYAGGLAVDGAGAVYVSDPLHERVCKITPAGTATALPLAELTLGSYLWPVKLAVDAAGNVYLADAATRRLMRLSAAGPMTALATLPPALPPPYPRPSYVVGLAVDALGNVFVADEANSAILRVTAAGAVAPLAGAGPGYGSTDGSGSAARFFSPRGLAVDTGGNVYIADSENDTIRKMTPGGAVTTLAGLALNAGSSDGTGSAARFNNPTAVAVDAGGNVYVSDTGNFTVRKVDPAGVVTTLAGLAGTSGQSDGVGTAARFVRPGGLAVDAAGNVYVGDLWMGSPIPKAFYSRIIRKITPAGGVTWFAGPGTSIAIDRAGHLYAATESSYTMVYYISVVSRIAPDGTTTVLAGTYEAPRGTSVDGTGEQARFIGVTGLAADPAGNLFVTDGQAVRGISPTGVVTTLAGLATTAGSADGAGRAARFSGPTGIAVDSAGHLYVADTDNHTIRVGVVAGPPVIAAQPQSQTVASGGTAQFTVAVAGAPDPRLQWYRNGAIIDGATDRTLVLVGVLATDAGDYTVMATNDLGTVISDKATLSIGAGGSAAAAAGGGGGGAIAGWFVIALILLTIARWADGGTVRTASGPWRRLALRR
jgi:sugar lactone lactonase YvrE